VTGKKRKADESEADGNAEETEMHDEEKGPGME
jgi:hypothetical protein